MFNRRDSDSHRTTNAAATQTRSHSNSAAGSALIGASIRVEGSIHGSEDLMIQGEVRGTVELKTNQVTIGTEGRVFADVHAEVIRVEGHIDGHLVASEQVMIEETARITGSITAPRISLKDGAKFNGTIDMDPDAKRLQSVFQSHPGAARGAVHSEASPADGPDAQR
jgi:cytoskeletal protein CcmA (bactofilin family)